MKIKIIKNEEKKIIGLFIDKDRERIFLNEHQIKKIKKELNLINI